MDSQALINEIIAEKDWRISELEKLKRIHIDMLSTAPHNVREQYRRMCIPYIYAHWEGFIVQSFYLIIDFLNQQIRPLSDFKFSLIAFSKMDVYKSMAGKQSFAQSLSFTQNYITDINKPLKIERDLFNIKSNLNYKMLIQIFEWFSISTDKMKTYKRQINKLVNIRNKIAHGENGISIDLKFINELIMTLHELFDEIILILVEYIESQKYLYT